MEKKKFFGKKEIFFIAKFFAIFLFLQFIILAFPIMPVQNFIAETEAALFGAAASGNFVFLGSSSFEITPNCTGLLSGAIFIAVVFSMKKPGIRKKIIMAAAGSAALFALNIPRVFFVIWAAGAYGQEAAETIHEITWMTTAILVLAAWYFATKKIAGIKNFAELI